VGRRGNLKKEKRCQEALINCLFTLVHTIACTKNHTVKITSPILNHGEHRFWTHIVQDKIQTKKKQSDGPS